MEITLSIAGAYVITPRQFPDGRGVFLESFRGDKLAEQLGHRPDIVQTNVSVSARGTVRGIHFADVPPSQAKYITCLSGALVDYIIDIRVGSPTLASGSRCSSTRSTAGPFICPKAWGMPSARSRTTQRRCTS